MATSHLNPTPSGVLGTIAKLFRLSEALGVNWVEWQHPTNDVTARNNLAEYLRFGCPKIDLTGHVTTPPLLECANQMRTVLGDDFISPEQVAGAYGWTYTDEQLAHFTGTRPDLKTLLWLHDNGYMLVPGPVSDAKMFEVVDFDGNFFSRGLKSRYPQNKHKYLQTDVVQGGQWLRLRKGEVPNSQDRNLNEQLRLVTSPEFVPNAVEVIYAAIVYRRVNGINILPNFCVRTSSVSLGGKPITISHTNGDYFHIGVSPVGGHPRVGISSARN